MLDRRQWLAWLPGLTLIPSLAWRSIFGSARTAMASTDPPVTSSNRSRNNLIVAENKRPGTRQWMLEKTRIDPATRYRCPWIEGFVSHASIEAGETIQFFISTNPASDFTIEICRLGWYNGDGGRSIAKLGPYTGVVQPDPPIGEKRLRDCAWQASAEWTVPDDAVSGVYVGKLSELTEGLQSYVIFVVRDGRPADLIFQCSDHTWHAYNRWPNQFSLYDDGTHEWYWGGKVEVGFNRPYGKYCQIMDQPLSIGSGDFFILEFPFVFWLEQHGYDVTYLSNTDTHRDASTILRGKGFLSIGHDEYWTIEMFRNVQAAVQAGVSVGFFSGNAVCGRVIWNEEHRSIERVGVFGPPGGTGEFIQMASLMHERPYANELIGAHSTGPVIGSADWVCELPDHWVFAGTGMKRGEGIPGLVGWEYHGDPAPIPGLEIVATAPTYGSPGMLNGGVYTATVYPGPKSNFVFNASTCWWADGLSEPPGYMRPTAAVPPQGPDPRVQQITHNVLRRMLAQD